jgi:hypothetical protein
MLNSVKSGLGEVSSAQVAISPFSSRNSLFLCFWAMLLYTESMNSWTRCMGNETIGAYYTNV